MECLQQGVEESVHPQVLGQGKRSFAEGVRFRSRSFGFG